MKKTRAKKVSELGPDDMRPEYDFSNARPNPYAARFTAGAIAVVLDPDVAQRFPDAQAVNDSLRGLSEPRRPRKAKRSSKRRTA